MQLMRPGMPTAIPPLRPRQRRGELVGGSKMRWARQTGALLKLRFKTAHPPPLP